MKVVRIPALSDNYIWLLHNEANGRTAVVDPAVAEPVLAELKKQNWSLDFIINTHHHDDHVGGNIEIKRITGAKVIGYKGDAHRIPGIDIEVEDNEQIEICGEVAKVIFVPGHTLGHIVYYFAESGLLFCGDTIFAMGCGRLFEGSFEQMFSSLQKLAKLPIQTQIYCAHEYTENNGNFALNVDHKNMYLQERMAEVRSLRKNNIPTVPFTLDIELKTNPMLRAKTIEEFTEIRKLRNVF